MKPRPERTKTETKAEKRGGNENGTVTGGSSELCESYVSRRGTFLYSVATFPSPVQTQRDDSRPLSADIPLWL